MFNRNNLACFSPWLSVIGYMLLVSEASLRKKFNILKSRYNYCRFLIVENRLQIMTFPRLISINGRNLWQNIDGDNLAKLYFQELFDADWLYRPLSPGLQQELGDAELGLTGMMFLNILRLARIRTYETDPEDFYEGFH